MLQLIGVVVRSGERFGFWFGQCCSNEHKRKRSFDKRCSNERKCSFDKRCECVGIRERSFW